MSASSVWHRHRSLALLAAVWPELASEQPPARERLAELLERASPGWRVIEPPQKCAYEALVASGQIPTRAGSWHDVFNVVAFAQFPTAKRALHGRVGALQVARRSLAAARGSRANDRGREEDALALIDECSVVLAGSSEAIAAYEQVQAGPIERIDEVIRASGIRARVLGHALLEHLVLERPAISTTVVTVGLSGSFDWAAVDEALAERIASGGFPVPQRAARLTWPDPLVDAWLE